MEKHEWIKTADLIGWNLKICLRVSIFDDKYSRWSLVERVSSPRPMEFPSFFGDGNFQLISSCSQLVGWKVRAADLTRVSFYASSFLLNTDVSSFSRLLVTMIAEPQIHRVSRSVSTRRPVRVSKNLKLGSLIRANTINTCACRRDEI